MRQDLAMHRVVVLALDGVIPFEFGIPLRIFGAAADGNGRPLYQVMTCTVDGRPVRTAIGVSPAAYRRTFHSAGRRPTAP